MPRPPRHPHVLRTVLKMRGMTQKALAEEIGIASVTLEKFINGGTKISEDLAARIAYEVGLDFEQLLLNRDPLNPRLRDTGAIRDRDFDQAMGDSERFILAALQASRESEWLDFHTRLRLQTAKLAEEYSLANRMKELLGMKPNADLIFSYPPIKPLKPGKSTRKPKH